MKKGFTKQDFTYKLAPNGDCLEWTGGRHLSGYGATRAWGKCWYTHRLALELEDISTDGHCVIHSCDNPLCCNPAHLRLGTQQDNMADMVSKGRQARGAGHPCAKLTEQDVHTIRSIKNISQKEIAENYNLSQKAISLIIKRKTWQHI
jgi:hypothetical protein